MKVVVYMGQRVMVSKGDYCIITQTRSRCSCSQSYLISRTTIHGRLRLLVGLALLFRAGLLCLGLFGLRTRSKRRRSTNRPREKQRTKPTYDPEKVVQRHRGKHVEHAVRDEDSKVSPSVRVGHAETGQEHVSRLKLTVLAVLSRLRVKQVSAGTADVVGHVGPTSRSSSGVKFEEFLGRAGDAEGQ